MASTGLFTVDEAVYLSGIHGFWQTGTFVVPNAFDRFGSSNLGLWYLIEGRAGMVTQYPSGYSVLAAPFYGAFGIRGIILLNTLAAIGTLFAARALALRMFQDEALASLSVVLLCLATFFTEYAFGLWPHSVSVLCVTLALLFALKAEDAVDSGGFWLAVLSGLAIGAGLHARTDIVLILPVVGAHILLFGASPMRLILGGAVGLLPGLIVASLINWSKFGTFNPVSYGQDGGGVDPMSHLATAGVLAVLFGILLARRRIIDKVGTRPLVIGAALITVAAFALSPELRLQTTRYGRGVYTLFIDITVLNDPRAGVQHLPDGSVTFWGLWKKALGQSMPWLALVIVLMAHPWQMKERRGLSLIALSIVIWTLPYCFLIWHGGLGSNMRYFSPLLPLLAIAGAWAWRLLAERLPVRPTEIVVGVAVGLGSILFWPSLTGSGIGTAHQVFPTLMLIVLFTVGGAWVLFHSKYSLFTHLARMALVAGFAVAFLLGAVLDVVSAQVRRSAMAAGADVIRNLPKPNLTYGVPEQFATQIVDDNTLLATTDRDGRVDYDFLAAVLNDGFRVFTYHDVAASWANADRRFVPSGEPIALPNALLLEVILAEE